jgi:hypothetical protein
VAMLIIRLMKVDGSRQPLQENLVRDFDQLSSFSSKFSNKFGRGSMCTFQTDEIDCEFMNENKHGTKIAWPEALASAVKARRNTYGTYQIFQRNSTLKMPQAK